MMGLQCEEMTVQRPQMQRSSDSKGELPCEQKTKSEKMKKNEKTKI